MIGAASFLALIAAVLLLLVVARRDPGGEQAASMPQPGIAGVVSPTPPSSVATATPSSFDSSVQTDESTRGQSSSQFDRERASDDARLAPRDVSAFDLFFGRSGAAAMSPHDGVDTVEEVLELGLELAGASPVHVAVRGTASSDAVRCDWRGIARSPAQREGTIRFWLRLDTDDEIPDAAYLDTLFTALLDTLDPAYRETAKSNFDAIARGGLSTEYLFLTCYANYTVSEYLLGSGPSTVTVAYDRMGEAHSYELYEKEYWNGRFDDRLPSREEYEELLDSRVSAAEESLRARIGDHEGVVFLAPMGAHNAIAVEVWQAVAQWDVQRVTTSDGEGGGASGGVSGQVSGQSDSPAVTTVNAVRYGADAGDPEHTQTLSRLKSRISAAVGSSSGGSGGVSGQVDPPSGGAVSGQSDSSSGSGGSSTTATACPTPTAASSSTSSATATVTPTPTPTRVASVGGLRGYYESLGAYCFIGPYATATATPKTPTATPTATTPSGGGSTQTEPSSTMLATVKPAATALPTFVPSQPPAVYAPKPGSLTATASGEDTANLTWGAVTGASGYSVQHREKSSGDSEVEPWRTASGSVTGTSHRVTGLWCGKEHEFRVGAYGDGTAYNGKAGLWSASASATMGACTAQKPKFRSASYSFDVHTAMSVGGVVGKVSAYDVNGDAVTYSISGGNSAGKFGIGGSTGEITVVGSLASVAVGSTYTLTVGAADGVSGTSSVTVEVEVSAPTCRSGVAVVDPRSNYWLVRDCEVLLDVRDTLRGSGSLNWSAGTAITSWDGVTVGGTPSRVTGLSLGSRSLTGSIPPELGSLSKLTVLNLHENSLTGSIPPELGSLSKVTYLRLSRNSLTGSIPPELGGLASVTYFNLAVNSLTGSIPSELGNLSNLRHLWLKENRLSGSLPSELGGLSKLTHLMLWTNQLSGNIPGELGNLSSSLTHLSIHTNSFTGCNPAAWRSVAGKSLQVGLPYCNSAPVFGLSEYAFTVSEDADVGDAVGTVSASDIDEGDTLSYSIYSGNEGEAFSMSSGTGAVTVARSLDYETKRRYALTVVVNDGAGGRATTTASVMVTNALDVCLEGVAVSSPRANTGLAGDCEVLLVAKDTLRGTGSLNWSTGTAIESWDGVTVGGTPSRVTGLALGSRSLTGSIPWELGSLDELTVLNLNENSLTGSIPPELGSLSKVTYLRLSRNSLTGVIPSELGGLASVTYFNLAVNSLSGVIPPELGGLSNLRHLWLKENQLSGSLPSELGSLSRLTHLMLWVNRLSGEIPGELGGLSNLTHLAIQGNMFTGCAPVAWRSVGRNVRILPAGLPYCNGVPVFGSSEYAFTVSEDASVGSSVGSVSASDVDTGDTLSYSIVSGNEGGMFSISDSTGAVTVAKGLDYEAKRRYALTVQVSDGKGGTATAAVSVGVTNVLDVCLGGVAVSSPRANTGLAGDCEVLLVAKDTLRGTGSLNWSAGTAIESWDGVTVGGTPRRVTGLSLGSHSLTGIIPWELGSLGELTVLNLNENSLTGIIPWELGSLSKVTYLRLSRNSLTGVIPSELGGLESVTYFNLAVNSLTGSIPSELGNLSNLRLLWLKENRLSGSLPSELGSLSRLTHLMLWTNQLSGEIPSELGGLSNLTHLAIQGNMFTGCVPAAWRSVGRYVRILPAGLPYCNGAPVFGSSEYAFTVGEDASVGSSVGTVSASDVDTGDTLSYSIVSGNEGGMFSISNSTGAVTVAKGLDYETKRRYALTVQVSDGKGGMATVAVSVGVTNVLDVCLEGVAVTSPRANTGLAGDCEVLLVAKDTLRGSGSLNWSTETAIESWDGVTVGGTPSRVTKLEFRRPTIGALSKMSSSKRALVRQPLTGVIPPELGGLTNLTKMDFTRNSLTGVIPPELGGLTNLTIFSVGANRLTGGIPSEFGNLSNLTALVLDWNQLTGEIPSELGRLSNLLYLHLRHNRLTGGIPVQLRGLTSLSHLYIGSNSLTGCVPTALKSIANNDLGVLGLSYCHPAPGTLVIEFEDSRVRVSPPSVTGATHYEVELSGDGSTRTTSCMSPDWCSFTGRVGQSYTARARYTKTGTISEWSAPLTFTFPGFFAADSVSAARSGNSVTVRWTPAPGGVASQRVRLLYTASGCNFGDRAWDGPNHPISDGTTSSHTFASLDMSKYTCIFPLVYNYYPTGYTVDYGPTILVGKMPTPSIVLSGSSAYVIPSEISGAASYEAELSGDGSTRTTTCTNVWGCAFTGRVGQSYTARVRYTNGAGVVSGWSASKTFTFRGAMSSGSVSATRSGSSVTVSWTPVAAGVVSQRVVLTLTASGCSVSNRIWSDYSVDFADGTTRSHMFTNVDLSEYACIFPIVFNYFSSDKTVAAYRYGSGVRLTSPDGGEASGAGGVSGQAESPAFDLSRDIEFIGGLESARRFEFEQDPYAFSIREDAGTSAVVGVVRAGASDGHAESYAITAGNDDGKFAIGTESGEITAVAGLDYETTPSYILTVEARDGRGGVAAVTVEVMVSVSGAGPRDLIADASSDSVTLKWVAPEGGAATGYRVLRRRAQVEDAFVSLSNVATSTPMYVDSGDVVAGAKYVYRVVAVYDDADGDDARVSIVVPLPGPRGLVADASSDSVTLKWVAPEGLTVTGYRVLRRRAQVDDAFVTLADVAASTSMYVDSGDVVAGAKYVYRVVAVYDDADGDDARVSVVVPLPGPRDLVADASSDSVTLKWVAPEGLTVTGYRVLRRRAQVDDAFVTLADVAASTSMYVDTRDVAAGVSYVYRVVAVYDDADGGDARVAVTTPGSPIVADTASR